MGSPRVEAMGPSLAMAANSKATDSSQAPIIPLRATDSRTSTTAAAEGVVEAGEVSRCFQFCLIPIFWKDLCSVWPLP